MLTACGQTLVTPLAPIPITQVAAASPAPATIAAPTRTNAPNPVATATNTPEAAQPTYTPTESRARNAPPPKMAQQVSGKVYTYLTAHPLGVRGFALNFAEDKTRLKLYFMLFAQELEVGTGDTFQYSSVYGPNIRARIGLKGGWVSDDSYTLYMDLDNRLGESRLVFREEAVDIYTRDSTGERQDRAELSLTFPTATAATIQIGQHAHSARIDVPASGLTRTVQLNYLLYRPN